MDQAELFATHQEWAMVIGQKYLRPVSEEARRLLSKAACDQCALMGLWVAVKAYEPGQGPFKSFAQRRIIGEIKDELRREGKIVQAEEVNTKAPANTDPLYLAIQKEQCRRLLRRVSGPPRARTVVRLTAEGYTQIEIAARLQITRRWVQVILQRARAGVKAKAGRYRPSMLGYGS